MSRRDGGTSIYMQQLSEFLGKMVELHIVAHRALDELPVRHAHMHYLSPSWKVWRVRADYLKLLHEVRPDVVHVNCCWHPCFAYAVLWAKAAGYPVVLSPHGMLEPWIMRRHYLTRKVPSLLLYQRRALFASDLIHATSENESCHIGQIADYCSLLSRWNPRIRIVGNGVDVRNIVVKDSWKRSCRLLFISRLHPKKGIDLLLHAFAGLAKEGGPLVDYMLQIAGEGDSSYLEDLKRLAVRLGLDGRVEWLGGVYAERKWALLREADLLVLPTYSENFGIVVAEALASGTPVLTTIGTPWRELRERQCGWVVDVNADAISEGLRMFAATGEDDLRLMGLRGRSLVETKYDNETIAREFVEMYRSLCF